MQVEDNKEFFNFIENFENVKIENEILGNNIEEQDIDFKSEYFELLNLLKEKNLSIKDLKDKNIKIIKIKEDKYEKNRKKEKYVINEYPKSTSYFRKNHYYKMRVITKCVPHEMYIVDDYKKNIYVKNEKIKILVDYYKNYSNYNKTNNENKHIDDINRYIKKMNEIIINKKSYESVVDDFIRNLFEYIGLDNEKNEKILSQYKLDLNIGKEKISSIPDIICKKSNGIIWLVEESKHTNNNTCLQGDIQLICHMLAAIQYNKKKFNYFSKTILGVKIKNTKIFFYKMNITNEYLKNLEENNFIEYIYVHKFPEKGIDIELYNYNSYRNIEKVCNILYNFKIIHNNLNPDIKQNMI